MMRRLRLGRREDGAVMIIVMLTILIVTATAVFAIHSTSLDVRAAGHTRQAHQTQYVSESGEVAAMAWLDRHGPEAVEHLERLTELTEPEGLSLAPYEPAIDVDSAAYRLEGHVLGAEFGLAPVDQDSIGGLAMAYAPRVFIDVYDRYEYTATMPGERSDGRGQLAFAQMTMTARGRTRVVSGEAISGPATEFREFNEGAADTRARVVSGPFAGGNR